MKQKLIQAVLATILCAGATDALSAWRYKNGVDLATGQKTITAWVTSSSTFNLDFPYEGTQNATLGVRKHEWGRLEVYFSIEQGEWTCEGPSCYVSVRFDDGQPRDFPALASTRRDSTIMYLADQARFVQLMRKSKVVRIEVEIYRREKQVLTFDVSGYSPD
jgi:hypothetical protein